METYHHDLLLKNSVSGQVIERDGSHYAHLKIRDDEIDVLDLKIEASDPTMAKKITANFKKNPEDIYSEILRILTEEDSK